MKHLISIVLLFFFFIQDTQAQTCSCASTPITNSIGLGTVSTTSWQLQWQHDYHTMRHLVAGNKVLEKNVNQRASHTSIIKVTKALHPKFQATAIFSWINQRFSNTNTLSASGIGDLLLMGQYQLFGTVGSLNKLYLGAGVKMPTGATEKRQSNLLLGPDLQPGTGAWDGIASLLYTRSGLWNAQTGLQASLTYRITSEAQRFRNQQAYQFGSELLAQLAVSHSFSLKKNTLTASALWRYRQTQADEIDRQIAFNTGGRWINAGTAMQWVWNEWISTQGSLLLPIYRNVEGTQLTSSWRLSLGVVVQLGSRTKQSPELPNLQ